MGSLERSRKKVQLWKKAAVHFGLCFVMGFFTGFAPTGKAAFFSSRAFVGSRSQISPQPVEMLHLQETRNGSFDVNRTSKTLAATPVRTRVSEQENEGTFMEQEDEKNEPESPTRRLVIIVTPTSTKDQYQGVHLRRLANTLTLVPPPLLWIVVEKLSESNEVSEILRETGLMYRHLEYKENFTDIEAELDHQSVGSMRNVALKHIEHHRLSGIVHFAGLSNVYDLGFFDELREIEVFGTWAMALLTANNNKVIIEGPVCDSSQVIGWHLKKMNNETDEMKPPIHISSFGFNSSILWDPERWGRPSSLQHTSQDSMKFVKEVVLEDETKLKGIPADECSKIMLWRLHFPILKSSVHDILLNSATDGTRR